MLQDCGVFLSGIMWSGGHVVADCNNPGVGPTPTLTCGHLLCDASLK